MPKLLSLFTVWAILTMTWLSGNAQDSLRPTTTLTTLDDLTVTVVPRNDGAYALQFRAKDNGGEKDLTIQGLHRLYVGDDTLDVQFVAGRALHRVNKAPDILLVRHQYERANRDGTIEKLQPGSWQRLFHFQSADDGYQTHTIPLWWSIIPPLLAIVMALLFKEVIISLAAGIWLGALVLYGFSLENLFVALLRMVDTYVLYAIVDSGRMSVIIFSLLIGGMVAIISRNGGMAGVVQKLSKYAKSSQKASFITYILGIGIFFDDYANTLIVGNTMKPVTDRFRISREKLAYLVDSTAAPVAAIALVTTWIGAELGYIDEALGRIDVETSAYAVFLNSLQYAFYPIFTLFFIFLLIRSNRDFGSMRLAEIRAREKGEVFRQELNHDDLMPDQSLQSMEPVKGIQYRWTNAVIPILATVLVTIGGLFYTGYDAATWAEAPTFFNGLSLTIGNADSYSALIWGSFVGVFLAIILSKVTRTLDIRLSIEAMMEGFKTMLPAIVILILAWALADITRDMHTAAFLTSVFSGNIAPIWLPLLTFFMAALFSFSTGSAWGTMAILYPLILPTTWVLCQEAGMPIDDTMHIFYNVTAVVLGGAVLGDHCSPIADTTVLSSLATSCNHIDHVRTQLPYALTVGSVAALVGGVIFVLGLPWYVDYLIGFGLLILLVRVLGKRVPVSHLQQGEIQLDETSSERISDR